MDRSEIRADGLDLAFVTGVVADQEGLTVPRSHNLVEFAIEGPGEIVAVGNGDATSHEPFQAKQRTLQWPVPGDRQRPPRSAGIDHPQCVVSGVKRRPDPHQEPVAPAHPCKARARLRPGEAWPRPESDTEAGVDHSES